MEHAKFRGLITKKEQQNVDFKITCEAFIKKNLKAKAELAKDICAMANNQNTVSYIIIGVSDDGKNFQTVSNAKLTDTNIQSFCKESIYPPPKIKVWRKSYKNGSDEYKNKEFVIVQIDSHGRQLYHLAKDFIDYAAHVCYRHNDVWLRRGTTSDLATPIEIARLQKGKPSGLKHKLEDEIEYSNQRNKPRIGNKERDFHRLVAAGIQYERVNRFDLAIDCFVDALKLKPDDIGLHLQLGVIYGEKVGTKEAKEKAIEYCRKATKIDENSVSGWFNLAVYTGHLKKAPASLPIYLKAEELIISQGLKNTEIEGKLNIFVGHDFKDTGKIEEAERRYNKAISILQKLADKGETSAAFWLKDAKSNLAKLLEDKKK